MIGCEMEPTDEAAVARRRTVRFSILAVAAAALLGLAILSSACGSMYDGMGAMHGQRDLEPQTPVGIAASAVTVDIRNFDYAPRDLTVTAGTSITWVNYDGVPHDATDKSGAWGTTILGRGESAILVFDSPGVYEYYCTIHPYMVAMLTVT